MVTIANIWDEAANVLDAFADNELGDLTEEEAADLESKALAYLGELAQQEASKVDAIGFAQDKAKSQIDLLKSQEEKIRAKRQALERAQERFRQYLLEAMHYYGVQKVKGNHRTISLRKSEAVQVTGNPQDLPDKYREVRIEYKPIKAEIKKALKAGEIIFGAQLETRESVQIR
jgi:hypothetical protein